MVNKVFDFIRAMFMFVLDLIVNIIKFIFKLLNSILAWLGTLRWSRIKRSFKNTLKFLFNPIVEMIIIAISVFLQSVITIAFLNNILSWVIVGAVFMLVTQNFKGFFKFLYK